MSSIVVLGASGHGREMAEVIRQAALQDPTWCGPIEFLDDASAAQEGEVGGCRIRGGLAAGARPGMRAVLGVGYPEVKKRVLLAVEGRGLEWPSLVHPRASLGERVTLGRGCVVQAGAVLTCDIELADFVTINTCVSVNHDARIERLATLSPGARVAGSVCIGEGAFLGIGAVVVQGVRIGAWSVVGAGAVVLRDVPANTVVAGVPARLLEQRSPGWEMTA